MSVHSLLIIVVLYSEAEVQGDKILCHLTVVWGKFTGKGANKRIAKVHAARLARDAYQDISADKN